MITKVTHTYKKFNRTKREKKNVKAALGSTPLPPQEKPHLTVWCVSFQIFCSIHVQNTHFHLAHSIHSVLPLAFYT